MTLVSFVIQLMGATFLLLFAVRMVRTGVERMSGPRLRTVLVGENRSRLMSAMSGVLIAILLQSATASAMLTIGFISSGLLTFAAGLAIILGADLGSALVVQILTFKLDWLVPVLLATGGWLFLKFEGDNKRHIGRILLGVGLILVSLRMIGQASAPIADSELVPVIAGYLQREIVTAFILGIFLAFVMHSSVAAILLCVALAVEGVITAYVGVGIVLGANVGSALLPVWLSRNLAMTHRSVVFANLIIRASCAIIALAVLANAPTLLTTLPMTPGQTLVSVHLVFNTLVVFSGLMVLGVVVKVNERFQTAQMVRGMSAETLLPKSTLDLAVVGTPSLALACITREVLRMGAMVQEMVAPVLDEFSSKAVSRKQAIELLEQEVNKSFDEIRLYAAHASQTEMSKKETKQARELVDFSISLESAADRVVKIMLPLAVEKRELNLRFSEKGWAELNALHQHIMANMQTALNVLVSEDLSTARLLVEEKDNLSKRVRKSRKKHLKRLGSGEELSFDTSDIHLEALNALKDINSFFASVAYPILYRNNALRDSKLVEIVDAENKNDITI